MADPELEAMEKVRLALADLDPAVRDRVVRWACEKFELLNIGRAGAKDDHPPAEKNALSEAKAEKFEISLASYIRSKAAEGSQALRFLVTADWLRRRGRPLSAAAVAKALVENQQSRLANAADCLNKNVAKGWCEKNGDGFFVTPEGLKELGYK
jgi:hypothetical protein